MATREVIAVEIMLQKKRLEVCQCVFFTKESPHVFLIIIYITAVKLMSLYFLELLNQFLGNGEILIPVGTR